MSRAYFAVAAVFAAVELVVMLAVRDLISFWFAGGVVSGLVGGLIVGDLSSWVRQAVRAWMLGVAVTALAYLAAFGTDGFGVLVAPMAIASLPLMLLFGSIGCLIRTPTVEK